MHAHSASSLNQPKVSLSTNLVAARKPLEPNHASVTRLAPSILKQWSGYFKKSVSERHALLNKVKPDMDLKHLNSGGLTVQAADVMVENCVGQVGLPLGVAPTFIINGKHFVVPMCVEEPSVIAAATGAAKLVGHAGGFFATSTGNLMTGQVQLVDIPNAQFACRLVNENRDKIIDVANSFCQKMKNRGGGVLDVIPRVIEPRCNQRSVLNQPYLVVHFEMDVREAMGANIVNTVAEGLAPYLEKLTAGRAALKILTNLCVHRRTVSTFRIPVKKLSWKGVAGERVAERILEAFHFAEDDVYRATTNNKGIMNGIDAAAIATGQDWRAIEAAAHAFAATKGSTGLYGPLTQYYMEDDYLVGRLELPMPVGTCGGALHSHPLYSQTLKLLGSPDSQTLAQILVSVGLAQNFAAIRALAVEGIQRGHMSLHARNVAAAAGVPMHLISEVAAHMVSSKRIHQDTAVQYMKTLSPDALRVPSKL